MNSQNSTQYICTEYLLDVRYHGTVHCIRYLLFVKHYAKSSFKFRKEGLEVKLRDRALA
jgi:hypothetical protein